MLLRHLTLPDVGCSGYPQQKSNACKTFSDLHRFCLHQQAKPLGVVESTQGRVEYQVEGLKVPIMGYYDLKFWNGPIVDLKTSHSLPSSPSHPHCRQVAFYVAAAGEQDGRLAYVTPKKSATYKVEDVQAHIDAVAKVALTIQRFLSVSSDPMELAGLVSPDVDSFYFSEPLTRKMVNEVWGV